MKIMKTIKIRKFLLLAFILTTLISCGKEASQEALDKDTAIQLQSETWQLKTINQQGPLEDHKITLKIDSNNEVKGNSGCNDYSGYYQATKNRIIFEDMITTEMTCRDALGEEEELKVDSKLMKQESEYSQNLSQTQYYIMENDELIFYDKTGKKLLVFEKESSEEI